MDDEIREELHAEMGPCAEQKFFDAYVKKHEEEYGEDFVESFGLDSTVSIGWLSDAELIKAAEDCEVWGESSLAWVREVYENHDLDMDEIWEKEGMEEPQELLNYIEEHIGKKA